MSTLPRPVSRLVAALATLSLALTAAAPTLAVEGREGEETTGEVPGGRYFVLHPAAPLAAYGGGIEGLAATDPSVTGAERLDISTAASQAYLAYLTAQHDEMLAAIEAALGRDVTVVFSYRIVLNGLALEISAAEAGVVEGLPAVARVVPDTLLQLQTDKGPGWIGAPSVWDGSSTGGAAGSRGEGVVIGVIDTGVNSDHPSFADVGGDGYDHSNPRGRFFGLCDPVTGLPFCNDKLIGVYDFTGVGTGPEDDNGHGSHTAGTAGGNVLEATLNAPTMSVERRIAGVAPHANLITYKACFTDPTGAGGCLQTSTTASIDQAAADAVDVINFSIGGSSSDPWADLNAIAFLNARRAGVFASVSAGNDGPGAGTIGSPSDAPWVTSVGASTHDRKFINSLVDMSGGATAAPSDIAGKSITAGYGPAPIVYAGDFGDPLCQTPFPPGTWTNGEIVICDRGINPRLQKADNVATGGAEGFVLANDEPNGDSIVADAYSIPGVHIGFAAGQTLKAWVGDGGAGHTATITGTVFDENVDHGDVMGSFSSRGPNPSVPDVLKPDVTAPGVDIFAAWMGANPLSAPEFNVISGTSMSSPHNAGAAALMRAVHPEWSPDEVRSALMTTSFTVLPGTNLENHDVLKEDATTPADPFDFGAGRVDLTQAALAGLTFDEDPAAYDAANPTFGGDPASLNLPSLSEDFCSGSCAWQRTVTGAADGEVTWTATVAAPDGMAISVEPSTFTIGEGATQELAVSADVSGLAAERWHFARVHLVPDAPGIPDVELPVATFVQPTGAALEHTVLHFHGNTGAHDSGETAEADCVGNGALDLSLCGGPFLLESAALSDAPAARYSTTVVLDCTIDRCEVDPNWVWNLDAPTTLSGQMTVEWWVQCAGCNLLFFDDFTIRLWADGALVLEQVVRHNIPVPGVPTRLASTVLVPEVTASETFVLHVDPVFVNQDETSILYDSSAACPGGTVAPCDSLVRMPVVGDEPLPDLQVTGLEASRESPRASEPVTITATVTNTGDGPADVSTTEFILDDATVLGTPETAALGPGDSTPVSVEWDTRGQSGEHTITATADGGEALVEEDEANNSATLTVTVRGNRVENGSFEAQNSDGSGPDAWSGESTAAGEAGWAEGGSHGERSVVFTGNGGNAALAGSPSWTSAPIAVSGGETLTVTAGVSAQDASSAASIGLVYLGAAGEVLDTVTVLTAPLTTDGFELLEDTVTVPAAVGEVRVVLRGFTALDLATGGSVTFDDVGVYGE